MFQQQTFLHCHRLQYISCSSLALLHALITQCGIIIIRTDLKSLIIGSAPCFGSIITSPPLISDSFASLQTNFNANLITEKTGSLLLYLFFRCFISSCEQKGKLMICSHCRILQKNKKLLSRWDIFLFPWRLPPWPSDQPWPHGRSDTAHFPLGAQMWVSVWVLSACCLSFIQSLEQ